MIVAGKVASRAKARRNRGGTTRAVPASLCRRAIIRAAQDAARLFRRAACRVLRAA